MRRRRKRFWIPYDPVEEFIGQQRRSLWHDNMYMDKKPPKHKEWQYESHHNDSFAKNNHEDMLIEAIDRKYHSSWNKKEAIRPFLEEGYTQQEIAAMLGISERTVSYLVEDLKKEMEYGKKEVEQAKETWTIEACGCCGSCTSATCSTTATHVSRVWICVSADGIST